jgi:hypothetical protein
LKILEKLLPNELVQNIGFIAGSGRSSAHSLTSSILAAKKFPVALVLDADTDNEQAIQEQKEFLHEMLRYVSADIPFEIFFAVPEIEVLFFEERSFIEKLINHKVSNVEWKLARSKPKNYLKDYNITSETILKILDQGIIETIRKHPLIVGLTDFLTFVIVEKNGIKSFAKQELTA